MTKARGLGRRAGGDHVADLDLTVRDDHPRHQPLDQLALLCPCRPIKPLPHTPAKLVQAQSNTGDLGLAVYLRVQLAQLSIKSLPFLLQSAASAPELVQTHHARQVSLREPLDLLLNAGLPAPQRLPTRLQVLRQPVAAMRPLQGKADRLRLVQQPAQILPHQRVHLLGRNVAGGALRLLMRLQSRELAATAVAAIAGRQAAPQA